MSSDNSNPPGKAEEPPGLIRLFIGRGQGKTWAALGCAFRATACGMKVHVIQFMKTTTSSEPLSQMEKELPLFKIDSFGHHCPFGDLLKNGLINCRECRKCYVSPKNVKNMDREFAELAFEMAWGVVRSGEYSMLVLDEVLRALQFGLFEEEELLRLMEAKPERLEMILTGPEASPEVFKRAHKVTYLMSLKEPFDFEAKPRMGIDY
jgi:cob(I)alamin adenosyltransferase